MSGFDKFAWMKAVCDEQDAKFTEGVKYVLLGIALFYPRHGGEGLVWSAQQSIAEDLNVSERLVKTAYAAARHRGYFVLTAERKRGRGHHAGNTYRLVIPQKSSADPARNTEESGAQNDGNTCTKPPEYVHKTTVIRARNDSENAPPAAERGPEYVKTMDITMDKRMERASVTTVRTVVNTPPPTPFCDEHPGGTADNCRGCLVKRKHYEHWQTTDEGIRYAVQQDTKKRAMKPSHSEIQRAKLAAMSDAMRDNPTSLQSLFPSRRKAIDAESWEDEVTPNV